MLFHSSCKIVNALEKAGAGMDSRYHVTARKRVALTKYLYQVAGKSTKGSHLLDVGCGHGLDCISAAMLGATCAVGIDVDETGISHMEKTLRNLERQGLDLNIEPLLHNVADGIPYEDNSFDVVLLVEAVSHILQLDRVLHDVLRVAKPGGVVVINDSNNSLIRGIEERTEELWERWEKGLRPGADRLPEHERSYKAMRQQMIEQKYPSLSQTEAEELAAATSGRYADQIFRVVDEYLKTGDMPHERYQRGTCPISPDGCYMERLFDPYDLARRLQQIGFSDTVVMAHLTHGNWLRAIVDTMFRLLPRQISMPLSRGFIVLAYK